MNEIAVFGGTFDPPTRAHEAIVTACLERPEIDEVWLMPSGQRLDKRGMGTNAARLAMLRLMQVEAFGDSQRLIVTDFEQRLPQPTTTWSTSRALQATFPEGRFWYVFGADAYQSMPSWQHGRQLQKELAMLIVPRDDIALPEETAKLHHLNIHDGHDEASSTTVRRALAEGSRVTDWIRPAVAGYALAHCLYNKG